MERNSSKPLRPSRRTLTAGIASALALAAPAAFAAPNVWQVQNCNDDGDGSLRATIAAATTLSGDTVDLSARTDCVNSRISLQLGEITIPQASLTIVGPGSDKLTVDGTNLPSGNTYQNNSRVLTHTGGGTLEIHGLTLYGGHIYHNGSGYKSRGGCLYSAKDVVLESVDVRNCSVQSLQSEAGGGGVYAKGSATLDNVTMFGNTASGNSTTRGGGIAALGKVTATGGLIKNNTAISPGIVLGAGISAPGGVSLDGTAVLQNNGISSAAFATGGGIYTRYDLSLTRSTISGNAAKMSDGGNASAGSGGAFSFFGPVSISYSTIADNAADGIPVSSTAGALSTLGSFRMDHSTVSGNTTTGSVGGIFKTENCGGCTQAFYMRDSTVSGNHAGLTVGGIDIGAAQQVKLLNSTIAFNTAGKGQGGGPGNYFPVSTGLQVYGTTPTNVSIHSMLISNNTYGAGNIESDFGTTGALVTFSDGPSNSLIRQTSVPGLPSGIITGACPLLGPLRDNGGLTKTHALSSSSPAIDAGDNVIGSIGGALNLNDQRGSEMGNGTATYLRVSGLLPDIGGYEVQQDDVIYNASFEGCP